MKYVFLFLFAFSNLVNAETESIDIISFYYSPVTVVEGDLEEEEDIMWDDDYAYMTLDPGTAMGLRWVHKEEFSFYVEYLTINTESESGKVSKNKYQAITAGSALVREKSLNEYVSIFGGLYAGVGGSRFHFNDTKYRAHADLSAETGVIIGKILSIGVGGKYQIIGYPSETMAQVWGVNLTVGLWF